MWSGNGARGWQRVAANLQIRRGRRTDFAATRLVQRVAEEAARSQVTYGDQYHAQHCGGEHASDHAGADIMPAVGARAGRTS